MLIVQYFTNETCIIDKSEQNKRRDVNRSHKRVVKPLKLLFVFFILPLPWPFTRDHGPPVHTECDYHTTGKS